MFPRLSRSTGPGYFELGGLPFLFFGGASTLTHLGLPNTLHGVLSGPVLLVWTLLLTVGSFVGFVGCIWWGKETLALIIEQCGLIALFGATLIYLVVLFSLVGDIKGLGVITAYILSICVQAGGRVVQIFFAQRSLVELSRALPPEDGE